MPMFTLYGSILLVRIGTRDVMCDANLGEERIELLVLSSPIGLHCYDFAVKEALH